jgi:hypothetical protein
VDTYPAVPRPATVEVKFKLDRNPAVWYPVVIPAVVEVKLLVRTKLGPMMELTCKTCVLTTVPTFTLLTLMKKVLRDKARMSGKSMNPSPVSKVMVLTVRFDMVALDAKNVLTVALLELNERLIVVEKVEKNAFTAVVDAKICPNPPTVDRKEREET